MTKNIARIIIPSFQASVAQAEDPSLKKRPFVISWPDAQRAVVIESSTFAMQEGVKRGMNLKRALRLVPGLVVVPPSFKLLKKADNIILETCRKYSPAIEFQGGGQIFVDLGGTEKLWGKALDTASRISGDIRESFPSPVSVGTGSGKTISHVAASIARPAGLISVSHGSEKEFIFPQPVFLLPGIGRTTFERLSLLGIEKIGELAGISPSDSIKLLGKNGLKIRNSAFGNDSIQKNSTDLNIKASIINPNDSELIEKALSSLMKACEKTGLRLRGSGFSARKVQLSIYYSDGIVRTASFRSPLFLRTDEDIFKATLPLMKRLHYEKRTRIRTLSLKLSELDRGHLQTDIFYDPVNGSDLQSALDTIRSKYGDSAVTRALTMI